MIIHEKTFEEIYNSYFEIVCRFLNYYTHDRHAIEEVVQDVFVRLWEDYQGQEIRFVKTYLYNSARNRMLNYLRDKDNHSVLLEKWAKMELQKEESEDCVDREEFLYLLQAAVDSLPGKCKEIFLMSREEDLSYKEIATIRNISLKTVENQMGIALKKIREYVLTHGKENALFLILLEKIIEG